MRDRCGPGSGGPPCRRGCGRCTCRRDTHQRPVEGVFLPDLDLDARAHTRARRGRGHGGVGGTRARPPPPGRPAPGCRAAAWPGGRRLLGAGDGEAVGAGGRAVEGREEPVLDLLGQLVLERRRQAVGLGPAVAQHVGQEALDDAVAADHAHGPAAARPRSAPRRGTACARPKPLSASRLTVAVMVPGATPSDAARSPVRAPRCRPAVRRRSAARSPSASPVRISSGTYPWIRGAH